MAVANNQTEQVYKYVEKINPRDRRKAWISRVILWIFVAIVIFPLLAIVTASLTEGTGFASTRLLPEKVSFANYSAVINDTDFLLWVKNSMVLCLSVAAIQLLMTLPAAFAFSKLKFAFRSKGLLSLLILQMFPTTMALPAILTIAFNLEDYIGISGMDNIGVIILLLCGGSAYNIWLMKGYMDGIPNELTEAAYVDGATTMQMFVRIVLPLMRNMILVVFLFAFINAYSEFIFSSALLKDPEVQTVATGMRGFIKDKFASNWTQYSAAAILASVPVVALFMGLQKYLASGLTAGAVKG
ncbi:MAG: ABC transporter permease subunit [Clostridium sp.]|nr:ABC transporter permease subunit [Clostridium sp.]MDY3827677.1 ABC transporter permease subunit [Clostridium sp.]